MAKKITLSAEDKRSIEAWDEQFGRGLDALEAARKLTIGDYLVLYTGNEQSSMKLQMNSYGAPTKYMVVSTSRHGVPFVKKVNKKGTPVGILYSCTGTLESDDYRYAGTFFEFRLDPDFADAILLQDEYDPSQLHKTKQEIFKAVTKHNKEVKISTATLAEVVAFFQSVKIGDTLWTSNSGYYLVQDTKTMSARDFNGQAKRFGTYTNFKGPFVPILTVRDKNNKIKDIPPDFFYGKALYKERPRTYKELKI